MKFVVAVAFVIAAIWVSPVLAQGNSVEHSNGGASADHRNIASLAAGANAAHASPTALAHANPKSMVGIIKIYADLEAVLSSGELQQEVTDAQDAFDLAFPDFDSLTFEEQLTALASPEGMRLTDALQELQAATAERDAALAELGPHASDPEVKAYIDALLAS